MSKEAWRGLAIMTSLFLGLILVSQVYGPLNSHVTLQRVHDNLGANDQIPEHIDCLRTASFKVADMCHANASVKVSAAAALISLIMAGFALLSILYSHDSTRAALKASEAARDAISADRAWITIGVPEITWNGPIDAKGLPVGLFLRPLFVFENTGRSPATNVRSMTKWTLVPPGEPYEFPVFDLDGQAPHVLGASKTYATTPDDIVGDNALRVLYDKADMYLAAEVIYDDVFGGKYHRTRVGLK